MIRDHLGNVAPNELMNPLWTRIRRFIILIQHDPSDLGTLILILIRNAPRYLGTWKRLDVELQVVIKNPRQAKYTSFKIANLPLVLRLADRGSITSKKYLSSVSLTLSFNTGRSQLRGKLHAPLLQINSNTLSPIMLIEYPLIRTLRRP